MTAAWTAERLDALPAGTLIQVIVGGDPEWHARVDEPAWWQVGGGYKDADVIVAEADSIRVVSVPIEALLSDEALEAAFEGVYVPGGFDAWDGRRALRAAIAHVTGEAAS